ncbi:hypothetical protein QR680_001977 [Steinernema hermaphroditum]|uniref:Uncharacterized protein n=1 Tax=Steinernema hermaphroditum TaxID=289476 RepID=A0AA39H0T1_9BILA|nr:hypothetical protein QR680_001977 [Steinernema hermaphroditum]
MGYAAPHNSETPVDEDEPMEVDESEHQTDSNDSTANAEKFLLEQYGQSLEEDDSRDCRSLTPDITFEDVVQIHLYGRVAAEKRESAASILESPQQGPYTKEELQALTKEIAECSDSARRQAKCMVATLSSRGTHIEYSLLKFDVEYHNSCWNTCLNVLLPLYKSYPKNPDVLERVYKVCSDLVSGNRRQSYEIVSHANSDELADMLIGACSSSFDENQEKAKFFIYATVVLLGTKGFMHLGRKLLEVYFNIRERCSEKHEGITPYDVVMLYMVSTIDETNLGDLTVTELAKLLNVLSMTCFVDHYSPLPKTHYKWLDDKFGWREAASKVYGLCNRLLAFIIKPMSIADRKIYSAPLDDMFCPKVSVWLKENGDKIAPELLDSIRQHVLRYSVSQLRWYEKGDFKLICWTPSKSAPTFTLYNDWIKANNPSKEWNSESKLLNKISTKRDANFFTTVFSYLQTIDTNSDIWISAMTNMGINHCRSLMIQYLMINGKTSEAANLIEKFLKSAPESERALLGVFQMQLYVLIENFVRGIEFGLELVESPPFRTMSKEIAYKGATEVLCVISNELAYNYVVELIGHCLWRIATRCPESLLSEITIVSYVLFGQFAWKNRGFLLIEQLVTFLQLQQEGAYRADLTECVSYPYIISTLAKLRNAKVDTNNPRKRRSENKHFEAQQMFAKYFFASKAGFERLASLDVNSGVEKNIVFTSSIAAKEDDHLQTKFRLKFE